MTHEPLQQIIEYFLRSNANIERRDLNNCTPLLLASQECNVPAVDTLLKNKANIFAVDTENKTSLFHAAERNHKEVVERLLQDPVDCNSNGFRLKCLHIPLKFISKSLTVLYLLHGLIIFLSFSAS